VADRVEVTSRAIGAEQAWTWSSEGRGNFTMAPATRETAGTTIVLHMKADADEYLEPYRLETIVRKWADHITLPITVARDGKDEPANEGTALWRRNKSEVTEEQYEAFYRHLGHYMGKPWLTLHWRAEGSMEFSALLFVPDQKPFQALEDARVSKVRLHVRRMFITDEAELLPPWLRFVDGVVDTEDLPLNVSREMLQTTPVLARIRKAVTNRVLSELKSRAKDAASYLPFWENFGPVLKEGAWEDFEHQKDIGLLLRFRSTYQAEEAHEAGGTHEAGGEQDGWTSLDDYIGRMQEGQEAIYYLTGDNLTALKGSPQLEGFAARGIEVLLLTDPIDAFWPDRFNTYAEKPIRNVTQSVSSSTSTPRAEKPSSCGEPLRAARLSPVRK
jgi:molecular chaperone HtpG